MKKKLCGFVSKDTDATFAMCFFFLATSQYLSPEGEVGSVAFFFVLVGGGSRGFHREWGGYQSSLTEYKWRTKERTECRLTVNGKGEGGGRAKGSYNYYRAL